MSARGRPDYDPDEDYRVVCPVCAARVASLVDPECPACGGRGAITLGHPALFYEHPETVARAVVLTLEAACREALNSEHRARVIGVTIPETLARMARFGLVTLP
jgi:hypothetical protein